MNLSKSQLSHEVLLHVIYLENRLLLLHLSLYAYETFKHISTSLVSSSPSLLLCNLCKRQQIAHLKWPRYFLFEFQSQNNLIYVILRLGAGDKQKSLNLQLLPAVFVVWKWTKIPL